MPAQSCHYTVYFFYPTEWNTTNYYHRSGNAKSWRIFLYHNISEDSSQVVFSSDLCMVLRLHWNFFYRGRWSGKCVQVRGIPVEQVKISWKCKICHRLSHNQQQSWQGEWHVLHSGFMLLIMLFHAFVHFPLLKPPVVMYSNKKSSIGVI